MPMKTLPRFETVPQNFHIRNPKPLVTALICNYNYGHYLAEAIDSALAQTWNNLEVLVVDDGSTDDSREVLKRYAERIRIILKDNGGQASAFNAGIAEAHGEIICFLDSDDTWKPEKVERVVAKYQEASWGLVCHDLELIDARNPSKKGRLWTEFTRSRLRSGDLLDCLINEGYPWVFPPTAGMSLPISIARQIVPMPESEWRICADNPIAYAAVCHAPVGVIRCSLGSYRIHSKNSFAGTYDDSASGLVFSIVHPVYRYFFLHDYKHNPRQCLPKTPKDNYRYFRRWCFIASDEPWRYVGQLLTKNFHYFRRNRIKFYPFKILAFSSMDIIVLLSILLNLPNKYLKSRERFRMEIPSLDPNTKAFLAK